jgi:hypothetical protein
MINIREISFPGESTASWIIISGVDSSNSTLIRNGECDTSCSLNVITIFQNKIKKLFMFFKDLLYILP